MIRFAGKGTAFEALEPNLEGPTALAVSKTDATAPARILAEFAKTAPALEIKGGVVEGVYYDEKGMAQISSIPSREVLLGKLLGSYPVSDHQLCPRAQADRRSAGRRKRRSVIFLRKTSAARLNLEN